MIPRQTPEQKELAIAALIAKQKAHTAWLATLPVVTLGWYHENQPLDETQGEEYEQEWMEADFSIGQDLYPVAWTEKNTETGQIAAWVYNRKDQEVFFGCFEDGETVYVCG